MCVNDLPRFTVVAPRLVVETNTPGGHDRDIEVPYSIDSSEPLSR